MIDESTKEKLRALKISEMIEVLEDDERTIRDLDMTFDERFTHIIDDTYQRRHNKNVANLIRSAHFRYPCDISNIIYKDGRNLDKKVINEIATCDFIRETKSVIIKGAASSGKTWLSCAIGRQACKLGYKTMYIRLPDLLERIKIYGRNKTIEKFSKYQLLILDEWLLYHLSDDETAVILELIERRYDSKSTIYSSLFDIPEWYSRLGESTNADSIMERIIHNSYEITLGDLNMRSL